MIGAFGVSGKERKIMSNSRECVAMIGDLSDRDVKQIGKKKRSQTGEKKPQPPDILQTPHAVPHVQLGFLEAKQGASDDSFFWKRFSSAARPGLFCRSCLPDISLVVVDNDGRIGRRFGEADLSRLARIAPQSRAWRRRRMPLANHHDLEARHGTAGADAVAQGGHVVVLIRLEAVSLFGTATRFRRLKRQNHARKHIYESVVVRARARGAELAGVSPDVAQDLLSDDLLGQRAAHKYGGTTVVAGPRDVHNRVSLGLDICIRRV